MLAGLVVGKAMVAGLAKVVVGAIAVHLGMVVATAGTGWTAASMQVHL
jgi:hypothetical protein